MPRSSVCHITELMSCDIPEVTMHTPKCHSFYYLPLILWWLVSCSMTTSDTSKDQLTEKSDLISVASHNPLYFSSDHGIGWHAFGAKLPSEVQVSFVIRLEDEILVATDSHGLFMSINDRTDWHQIGTLLPAQKITALFQSNGTIFVGLFEHGIFSSNDLGLSWNPLNYNLPNLRVRAITDLNDGLFVGTDEGIFRLDRQQKSWVRYFGSVQVNSFNKFEGKIVAGTNMGVLLSNQQGEIWSWIHQKGAVQNTAIVAGKIAVMCYSGEVYMSNEWGSWYELSYSPNRLSYVYEMAELGRYLFMSNNYGIHRSSDMGKSWKHIFKTEEIVFMDFVVMDQTIYGGTKTWEEKSK